MQLKIDYETNTIKDKIQIAIDRLKTFEPEKGYYLAFSGGKDSLCIYLLAKMAGVKFDAYYARVTVDPPALVNYIRNNFDDVEFIEPEMTMWNLIPHKKMPPTRVVRYCCEVLKEEGGEGRFVVTGVRHAESSKRSKRKFVEYDAYGSQSKSAIAKRNKFNLMNDNDEKRRMMEHCQIKGKNILNPIIDWEDIEVWEFIRERNAEYCKLYDEGWDRIGCVGCPLAKNKNKIKEFMEVPTFYISYIHAFNRMIQNRLENDMKTEWETGTEVMQWWLDLSDQEFNIVDKKIKNKYLELKQKTWSGNDQVMKHVLKNIN